MSPPRRNQPALYELIGTRTKRPPVGPGSEQTGLAGDDESAAEERPVLLGPGRVVRLPVGYFFFGAAVVLAAAFGGYLIGYQVRDRSAEAEKRRLVSEGLVLPPVDPLAGGGESTNVSRGGNGEMREPEPRPRRRTQPDPGPESARTGVSEIAPGVLLVEEGSRGPWEAGMNHLVLASYGRENAVTLAEFLAGNGVPVVVAKLPRGSLWSVVTQRAFTRDPMRAAGEIGDFRERVAELGREFGEQGGWRKSSFADMYGARLLSR